MKNTVEDLIRKLQEIEDKKAIIHLEGCDCSADWNGDIELFGDGYVELKRN